jgi:hypothetical protein
MKNIGNKQLTKLIRDKRFTTTVENWGSKSTTYQYRITNIKMEHGSNDPTVDNRHWYNTIVNIVCSAYTTVQVRKKKTPKDFRTNPENNIDKRYNPMVRDAVSRYGDWSYCLRYNPREPRRQVRYALLSDTYNNDRTSNDLRNFLKHIGISGDLKLGTIKLVPTPGM